MNNVQTFLFLFALLASGLAVAAAWLLRSSSAPLGAKLALPTLTLVSGLGAAWNATALFGRPAPTTLDRLPERIELIAFKPVAGDTCVDLWIAEAGGTRAYEVPLDAVTRKALRQARPALADGRPATLVRRRALRAASGAGNRNAEERSGFELDPIQPSLPPKE